MDIFAYHIYALSVQRLLLKANSFGPNEMPRTSSDIYIKHISANFMMAMLHISANFMMAMLLDKSEHTLYNCLGNND